jgi:hypothetical protein
MSVSIRRARGRGRCLTLCVRQSRCARSDRRELIDEPLGLRIADLDAELGGQQVAELGCTGDAARDVRVATQHPVLAVAQRAHLVVHDERGDQVVDEHGIWVPVRVEVAQLAVGLTVTHEIEAVQGVVVAVHDRLHVELAWPRLMDSEACIVAWPSRARHRDGEGRPEGPESDIDDVLASVNLDERHAMGEARIDVLVVEHPSELDARIEPQFLEDLEQQSVLLEAVAPSTAHDDAVEQALGIQGQVIAQAGTDAAERKGGDMPAGDLCQEGQRRIEGR